MKGTERMAETAAPPKKNLVAALATINSGIGKLELHS